MSAAPTLDFFMSVESIWTFVGHEAFVRMCARHGLVPRYRPVPLQALFARTGGVAYRQRHLARQRYRDFELQRWCALRQVTVDLSSTFLPPPAALADRAILACTRLGLDPSRFAQAVLDAAWTQRRDVGDRGLLEDLATQAGLPAQDLLRLAADDALGQAYADAVEQAIGQNVFGAPSFVLDGEVFWGQDRLEMLDHMLAAGRAAYRPFQ